MQKPNIFLKCGAGGGAGGACCAGSLACPLGACGQALWGVVLPFVARSLLSSAFSLCLWCIVLEYALISRFKGILGGFMGFVWVCVVLVLCVACGAFVRVNS